MEDAEDKTNFTSRKNVTISLSEDDKELIDNLKKDLNKKNVTQVFNHLIEFYQENKPTLERYEGEKSDLLNKIKQLEFDIQVLNQNVSQLVQNSLTFLKSVDFNDAIDDISDTIKLHEEAISEHSKNLKNLDRFRNEVKSDIDGLYSRQHELDIVGIKKSIQQQQIDETKKLRKK
ncbi:MAG: hypothetical protein ACXAC2_04750 [Candidatus Kariarchaeaceae archaeon]|jgi:prefoldin subunit 5